MNFSFVRDTLDLRGKPVPTSRQNFFSSQDITSSLIIHHIYEPIFLVHSRIKRLLPKITPRISRRIPHPPNPRHIQILHRSIHAIHVEERHGIHIVGVARRGKVGDVVLESERNSHVIGLAFGAGVGRAVVVGVGDVEAVLDVKGERVGLEEGDEGLTRAGNTLKR